VSIMVSSPVVISFVNRLCYTSGGGKAAPKRTSVTPGGSVCLCLEQAAIPERTSIFTL
jgi:hypothetical protein